MTAMIAITAKHLYTPLERVEQPLLRVEDHHIVEIGSRAASSLPSSVRLVDFGEAVLAPGFVDVHIHGGAGHDVMEPDPAGLCTLERQLAQHGVTSYFPTTVTAPIPQTLAALDRLAGAVEAGQGNGTGDGNRAVPVGIHLEGPFLSHARRGVHPPENLLPPTLQAFDQFWEASRGRIKVMTIAPELQGAEEIIAEATRRGICVSLGHTDADLDAARAGVSAGARHATHLFNGMRPLEHRDPGIVGEVLTNPNISAEIIADGIHIDPLVVRLVLRMKGVEGAVLVTDATAATGMPDGRYRLGSLEVDVKGGRCLSDGKLAGSILTMDRAVQNVMRFAHWELQQALRPATLNPARVTGLTGRGTLQVGARADFVVLGTNGEVRKTVIGGAGL
jgi:N-acetylglucosamine-6-phosphate deacetylase